MAFTTIQGSAGRPDSFLGTAGVDVITLQNLVEPAFLSARQDNDIVAFSSFTRVLSNASLYGGEGDDTLTATNQATLTLSFVAQNQGNDAINLAALTSSTVQGNEGNDSLTLTELITSSLINGNQANDTLNVNAGASAGSILGGTGYDQITVIGDLTGGSLLQGNDDDDLISVGTSIRLDRSTINGNQGNDVLLISAARADAFTRIHGGIGNDTITAANSTADLNLAGDAGDDSVFSGTGNDSISGGDGHDDIRAQDGSDTVDTGSGNDTIFTNQGNDLVIAGDGDDEIQAGQGDDSVNAGAGNDSINGGSTGNDVMDGDAGTDTLTGFTGNDTLTGGLGADRFVFDTTLALNGTDTATDFNPFQGDNLTFAFGQGTNLSQAQLRGTGTDLQRRSAGDALAANTGFVISVNTLANQAAVTVFAESLGGIANGDIFYVLASTNPAAATTATLYNTVIADDGFGNLRATLTILANLSNLATANVTAAQLTQFTPV